MTARTCLVAALAFACVTAFASAATAASDRRALAKPLRLQPMTFFVVKGAPDSCGRGCDSWIEAEGKIESGTAARFKAFLRRLRDRNLPIYFASPGGSLEQAVEMGNMLHAASTTARVGRTLVRECGFEAQAELTEISVAADGRRIPHTIKISNDGWAGALESLLASCPPAKHPAIPAAPQRETVANKMAARRAASSCSKEKSCWCGPSDRSEHTNLAHRPFTAQPSRLHASA